jgi:hypothetical protein
MAILYDNFFNILSDISNWADIDLSAVPFSLPPNAVGIMVVVENTGVAGVNVGIQMKGSTDYYYNYIYPDEMRTFFIGVDASQVVECYSESADATFWLAGYFDSDDAVFFINGYEHSMVMTPDAWTTTDLMELPSTDAIATLLYTSINVADPVFGARRPTCTDDYKTLFSLIGGAISQVHIDTGVAYVDLFSGSATRIWDVGYLKRGTFKANLVEVTPSITGSWQTVDLSSDAGVDDGSAIIFAYDQSSSGLSYGVRSTSSLQEFYHKADMENWYVVKLDGSKQFQAKVPDVNMKLFLLGYLFGSTPVPPAPSPNNNELMRHLRWFHNQIDMGCYTGSRTGGGIV